MGITNTTTITCDKCNAVIPSMSQAIVVSIRQPRGGSKTLPYPARSLACSDACGAAILTACASALTA